MTNYPCLSETEENDIFSAQTGEDFSSAEQTCMKWSPKVVVETGHYGRAVKEAIER